MRKIFTTLCASALAAAIGVTSLLPATAAPVVVPKASVNVNGGDVIQIQNREWKRRNWRESRRDWRRDGREWRRDRREWRRDAWRGRDRGPGWYNGHRGYSYYRPGYRRYGDWWFPAAAFVTGAVIAGAIANDNPPAYAGSNAHVRWCYDRYRSYRASDNTFQPYNGGRRQCYSPYS